MALTPAALQGGILLTTTPAAIYTGPANTRAVIKRAVFSNVTASPATLTVTSTRSGGTALGVITAFSVPANSDYEPPALANWVVQPGDVLTASCGTAASVNAFINGFTVV